MPLSPLRICTYPGCRTLVRDAARCPAHAKVRTQPGQPQKQAAPFYSSSAWRKLRAAKLRADPLCQCEDCTRTGRVLAADTVDHRLERSEHPHLELDYDNLVSMSRSCHNRRHKRRGRG
jgi:5-methylcytosine-specific restriction protein A